MPTGGVTMENAGEWIKAGAVAIGVGSALVDTKAIASGNFAQITKNAKSLIESVRAARADPFPHIRVMKKTVSFGEIMLRLSPPGFERFFQSPVLAGHVRRR